MLYISEVTAVASHYFHEKLWFIFPWVLKRSHSGNEILAHVTILEEEKLELHMETGHDVCIHMFSVEQGCLEGLLFVSEVFWVNLAFVHWWHQYGSCGGRRLVIRKVYFSLAFQIRLSPSQGKQLLMWQNSGYLSMVRLLLTMLFLMMF